MSNLFCRIRVPYDQFRPVAERLAHKCDKMIIYEHNERPTNIHIHFYIQACQVSTDTIKNYCKKCGISGGPQGAGWSFKSDADAGCITYMTKGKLEPVYVKGFTQTETDEYKDRWVDRTPETSKSNKVTNYTMSMEVYELVKSHFKFGYSHTQEIYRECIIQSINVCRKYSKGFDEYSLRKIAHPAYTRFEHCHTQFVNKAVEKFFL